jgi:phage head maturation protease
MEHRTFTGEIRNINEADRSFEHPISDESPDAHGSIIKVDGWQLDRFRANPVVLFAHASMGLPIGRSNRIWKENGRLMSKTQFAGAAQGHQFAETAFKLVKDGFLKAWSVGFVGKEKHLRQDLTTQEKAELYDPHVYTKAELMEYSLVPVPSNPNALSESRRRDFDRLMTMAEQNSHVPDSPIGVFAELLEQAVARRLQLRGVRRPDPRPQLTPYECERYMATRSEFGPAETTVRELFGARTEQPQPRQLEGRRTSSLEELFADYANVLCMREYGKRA